MIKKIVTERNILQYNLFSKGVKKKIERKIRKVMKMEKEYTRVNKLYLVGELFRNDEPTREKKFRNVSKIYRFEINSPNETRVRCERCRVVDRIHRYRANKLSCSSVNDAGL